MMCSRIKVANCRSTRSNNFNLNIHVNENLTALVSKAVLLNHIFDKVYLYSKVISAELGFSFVKNYYLNKH